MLNENIINDGSDHGDQHQKSALEKHDEAQAIRAATDTLKYNRSLFAKKRYDESQKNAQTSELKAKL